MQGGFLLNLSEMTASRSRKQESEYRAYRKKRKPNEDCQFCSISSSSNVLIETTEHFRVIKNRFPYSMWDGHKVIDHLLVIPKKHTDTLNDLTDAEAGEYMRLISAYENDGYSVYARAPGSKTKSIVHQHTHLLKASPKTIRGVLFLQKPYFRITF
jgi:diadenosine tetraphosphate (Ap4A) HIT family hydrolase